LRAQREALGPQAVAAGGASELTRAVPASVGDALAVAEADPRHERLLAPDLAREGIGGRRAVAVQDTVEPCDGVIGERLAVGLA